MRVLVTGAAGFLGRHTVESAVRDNATVFGVDSFITSQCEDLERDRTRWGTRFQFEAVDVRTARFIEDALDFAPDVIFHLACPTGVPNLLPLASDMLSTSYEGTRNVLEVAQHTGARVVFASSAEVYGDPEMFPQSEMYAGNVDPLGPRNGYEEGKRVGETLCAIAARQALVRVSIARIFNTYGPGMTLDDTRVVPAFVRAALEGRDLMVHGDGRQVRCHCFASDTVDGLWRIALQGVPGRAYNLGSSVQHSVRELAEKARLLVGSSSRIATAERPSHDHQSRLPDTSRIRTELGWEPSVGLDEGLQATVADFVQRLAERAGGAPRTI